MRKARYSCRSFCRPPPPRRLHSSHQAKIAASGQAQGSKGKIVIATVKGDVHDIGKNIVRVILENYGYDVLDLGRDVDPERVVEAVRQTGAKLVGLSA